MRDERAKENVFGPGLVSAASNNDPTTVASLAVIGATTGYALCWLVILLIPMLAVVQGLAAGVGAVCRTSLQGAIRKQFGMRWAVVTFIAVAAVNVVTLAADVRAGSEALGLLTPIGAGAFVAPFTLFTGWLMVSQSYARIQRYLSVLPMIFICYVASAILSHVDPEMLLRGLLPQPVRSPAYAFGALALLGTTLTSYVYMWESIEVAEYRKRSSVRLFRRDAVFGMAGVGAIFVFILVTGAATLGRHHLPIETAADLAATLQPLAGPWASTLFGAGLLGSAILAVPVIAGTTAYVAAHTFGWTGSLDSPYDAAKPFYAVLLLTLAAGGIAAYAPVPAIELLTWASIAGGLATPLTLAFLIAIAANPAVMGKEAVSKTFAAGAWAVTGLVVAAGIAFLFSSPAPALPRT